MQTLITVLYKLNVLEVKMIFIHYRFLKKSLNCIRFNFDVLFHNKSHYANKMYLTFECLLLYTFIIQYFVVCNSIFF